MTGRIAGRAVRFAPALEILALWGLAGAQPVLDLFGRNPEFFLAADAGPVEIAAFGVLVAFAVPVVLLAIETIVWAFSPRWAARVHRVVLGLLAVALGLNIAHQFGIDAAVPALLLAAVTVAGVLWLRRGPAALALRYLGAAPLLFLALFLWGSEVSGLVFTHDAAVIETASGDRGPVAVVVFDELPLASLLRADGTINADRFPNFARLAGESTWFRNATSVSHATTVSVPTILTGRYPEEGDLATSADQPVNVFTLLGGNYEVEGVESVTDFCPDTVCEPDPESRGLASFADDVSDTLLDALVVYGHLSLPDPWNDDLPSLDEAWGGFLDTPSEPTELSLTESLGSTSFDPASTEPEAPREHLAEVAASFPARVGDVLVSHDATLPHRPWHLTPSGAAYDFSVGGITPGISTWPDSTVFVRRALQRHLLQVGWADAVLGRLLDRFEAAGTADRATIIVTADHGIAFSPGDRSRHPSETNLQEVYRVPLFVKGPDQAVGDGAVSDRPALTVDVLPTLLDLLGVEPPADADFDGQSLVADGFDRPEDEAHPVFFTRVAAEVPGDFRDLLPIARRNASYVGHGDWVDLLRVGDAGDLVGRRVDQVATRRPLRGRWELDQDLEDIGEDPRGRIPLTVAGEVEITGDDPLPDQVLVALDGVVVGVGDLDDDGAFAALLDERALTEGRHDVDLLLPTRSGRARLVSVR